VRTFSTLAIQGIGIDSHRIDTLSNSIVQRFRIRLDTPEAVVKGRHSTVSSEPLANL
jgi:hypothetical protein